MTETVLPRVPSDLIELALGDLVKCERSEKYVINMGVWYQPDYAGNGKCAVCLAGAVIAHHLGDGDENREPSHFGKRDAEALDVLDDLRTGNVRNAFYTLKINDSEGDEFAREIVTYDANPGLFKRQMRKLARDLRAAGY